MACGDGDGMNYREIAEQIAGEDSHTLPNGDVVRFRSDIDEHTTLADFDCYGRTEWVRTGWQGAVRPANMDGCAEIIDRGNGSVLWWQPPVEDRADRRRWHTDKGYQRAMREVVTDCHRYGFRVYVVELCRGTNAYGEPIVVAVESMGGFEPCARPEDVLETLTDMVRELLEQAVAA